MRKDYERPIAVSFRLAGEVYRTELRADGIIHEAIEEALPASARRNHRLQMRLEDGSEVVADHFAKDIADPDGRIEITVIATPLTPKPGRAPAINYGFDHLAIAVADRADARDFFHKALGLQVVRDDDHQTVLTSGHTALFMFDARPGIPLSDGQPSRWHHLGFVVDDLESALFQLQSYGSPQVSADWTLLEREERWSLYFHYQNGDVTFMLQLSEIKAGHRGLHSTDFTRHLYDYGSGPYGAKPKNA